MVSGHMFKPLNHFEFILVCGVKVWSGFIFSFLFEFGSSLNSCCKRHWKPHREHLNTYRALLDLREFSEIRGGGEHFW